MEPIYGVSVSMSRGGGAGEMGAAYGNDRVAGDRGVAGRAAARHDEDVEVVFVEGAQLSGDTAGDQIVVARGKVLGRGCGQIVSDSSQPNVDISIRVIFCGKGFCELDEILQAVDVIGIVREPIEILGYTRFEFDAEYERALLSMVLGQVREVGVVNDCGTISLEDSNAGVESRNFRAVRRALPESVSGDSDAQASQGIMLAGVLKFVSCLERVGRRVVVIGVLSCNCRKKSGCILDSTGNRLVSCVS